MPRVFVSIGSNIDKEANVRKAVRQLAACYGALTLSRVYESVAVGFCGDSFYNLVASFDTDTSVQDVAAQLANIERACGRKRNGNDQSSRTLDMDLLLYGEFSRHDDEIDVPRRGIAAHAFVLFPLAEIVPDAKHPETGITFRKMRENFGDRNQKLWPIERDFCL